MSLSIDFPAESTDPGGRSDTSLVPKKVLRTLKPNPQHGEPSNNHHEHPPTPEDPPPPTRLTIFSVQLDDCANPKTHYGRNPLTGQYGQVPNGRTLPNGKFLIDGCERHTCFPCAVLDARMITRAIQCADPTHCFTLTLVGDTAAEINETMKRFIRSIRRTISGFEWVWAAEENPAKTGVHVHGFCITEADYDALWTAFDTAQRRAHCGRIWKLEELSPGTCTDYFSYPMDDLADPALFPRFLELNGTKLKPRLIHFSRGFWRGGAGGEALTLGEAKARVGSRLREAHR